jgi:hypothetical protein
MLGISNIVDQAPSAKSDSNPGRPLSACEKCALTPYIPKIDLDNARVHTNGVPLYTPWNKDGITLYNDIYFRPGTYDPSTAEGLALLGHELVHVGQYRNGMTELSYFTAGPSGWEQPAEAMHDGIYRDLFKKGGKCCCK